MKQILLIAILGLALTGCAGQNKNISADDCGCPGNDRPTLVSKQQGVSADECGCPDNDRPTLTQVTENRLAMGD